MLVIPLWRDIYRHHSKLFAADCLDLTGRTLAATEIQILAQLRFRLAFLADDDCRNLGDVQLGGTSEGAFSYRAPSKEQRLGHNLTQMPDFYLDRQYFASRRPARYHASELLGQGDFVHSVSSLSFGFLAAHSTLPFSALGRQNY